jgi:hypothetical protein
MLSDIASKFGRDVHLVMTNNIANYCFKPLHKKLIFIFHFISAK